MPLKDGFLDAPPLGWVGASCEVEEYNPVVVMGTARAWTMEHRPPFGDITAPGFYSCIQLDCGATASFVTREAVRKCQAVTRKALQAVKVIGIGGAATTSNEVAVVNLCIDHGVVYTVVLKVMERIGAVKGVPFTAEQLGVDPEVCLADEYPSQDREIDILLGNDILWDMVAAAEKFERSVLHPSLMLVPTRLGVVLMGRVGPTKGALLNYHTAFLSQIDKERQRRKTQEVHLPVLQAQAEAAGRPAGLESGGVLAWQPALWTCSKRSEGRAKEGPSGTSSRERVAGEGSLGRANTAMAAETEQWVRNYLSLEALGVEPVQDSILKPLQKFAVDSFYRSLQFKPDVGCYQVGLIFHPEAKNLASNREVAVRQFWSLEKRFQNDEKFAQRYKSAMKDYVVLGDVEECTGAGGVGEVFYLPHSAVIREEKLTSKTRIVFNGSARNGMGVSLNDCLLPGPPPEQDIMKILIGFRWRQVAVSGDVKRMYLCILIREEDRDFLRFVWRENANEDLKEFRFKKVPFGLRDAPFIAQEAFKHHAAKHKDSHPEVAELVQDGRWVDDLLTSCHTKEEAKKLIKETTAVMATGGFALKKWVSSEKEVQDSVPRQDRIDAEKAITFTAEGQDEFKALGVTWDVSRDLLKVTGQPERLKKDKAVSKRVMARVVASIFDPLGIVSPVSITGKRLLQRAFEEAQVELEEAKLAGKTAAHIQAIRKKSWDKPVSAELEKEFRAWNEDSKDLKEMWIERCLVPKEPSMGKKKELHIFSDASLWGYCAVAYLRVASQNGKVMTSFVCAKSRMKPMAADMTMPRMELLGALIAARLAVKLQQDMDCRDIPLTCWTDSSVVYQWIKRTDADWQVWVSNRVTEIREKTGVALWRHVPGTDNPADWGTRGVTAGELAKSEVWKKGPEWLSKEKTHWPTREFKASESDESTAAKESRGPLIKDIFAGAADAEEEETIERTARPVAKALLEDPVLTILTRAGDLKKAYSTLALLLTVASKKQVTQYDPTDRMKMWKMMVKATQREAFGDDLKALRKGEDLPQSSELKKAAPALTAEGLLVAKGRFQELKEKTPSILPHGSRLVEMLINNIHLHHMHAGPGWVLYHLRKQVWLRKARRTVKAVLAKCVQCQKRKKKLASQVMAPLPEFRTQEAPRPWTYVGVDFAGPLKTQDDGDQWIALFTCMQVRAVHLELVGNMTTETFLLALRRFVARQGTPTMFYSDNGRTFVRAAKEVEALDSILKSDGMRSRLKDANLKWSFQVEAAPWWGALHERLVRSVKDCLKATLRRETIDRDTLLTILCEAEAVVNSRPLAEVSDDPDDPLPVTPSMLIRGFDTVSCPYPTDWKMITENLTKKTWLNRLERQQDFCQQFQKDYIQTLRERQKWHKVQDVPIKKGSLVLIEEARKRLFWPMGRVLEVQTGRDGIARSATIRTQNGTTRRPFQRLVPLEISPGKARTPETDGPQQDALRNAQKQQPDQLRGQQDKKEESQTQEVPARRSKRLRRRPTPNPSDSPSEAAGTSRPKTMSYASVAMLGTLLVLMVMPGTAQPTGAKGEMKMKRAVGLPPGETYRHMREEAALENLINFRTAGFFSGSAMPAPEKEQETTPVPEPLEVRKVNISSQGDAVGRAHFRPLGQVLTPVGWQPVSLEFDWHEVFPPLEKCINDIKATVEGSTSSEKQAARMLRGQDQELLEKLNKVKKLVKYQDAEGRERRSFWEGLLGVFGIGIGLDNRSKIGDLSNRDEFLHREESLSRELIGETRGVVANLTKMADKAIREQQLARWTDIAVISVEEKLDLILEAIYLAYQGEVTPKVLPETALERAEEMTAHKLEKEGLKPAMDEIVLLSCPKSVVMSKEGLMVVFHIPVVPEEVIRGDAFEVSRALILDTERIVAVRPDEEVLLVTNEGQAAISKQEWEDCQQFRGMHLCEGRRVMHKTVTSCVQALYAQDADGIVRFCRVAEQRPEGDFALPFEDAVFFAVSMRANLTCGKQTQEISVGEGALEVPSHCTLESAKYFIPEEPRTRNGEPVGSKTLSLSMTNQDFETLVLGSPNNDSAITTLEDGWATVETVGLLPEMGGDFYLWIAVGLAVLVVILVGMAFVFYVVMKYGAREYAGIDLDEVVRKLERGGSPLSAIRDTRVEMASDDSIPEELTSTRKVDRKKRIHKRDIKVIRQAESDSGLGLGAASREDHTYDTLKPRALPSKKRVPVHHEPAGENVLAQVSPPSGRWSARLDL